MKILAFDTNNQNLSVAVFLDDKINKICNVAKNGAQSEMLIPLIEECLRACGIWYQDLDLIAITNGPGSFTGVRIGLAAAKTLKLISGKKVIAVSSLLAMAYKYRSGNYQNKKYHKVLALIDAKLDEFYVQELSFEDQKIKNQSETILVKKSLLKNYIPKAPFILCSNTNISEDILGNDCLLNEKIEFIDLADLAILAAEISTKNQDSEELKASYIRKPKIGKS